MAKFITTSGTNFFLEELIKNAQEKLILVSPYLQPSDRTKELLADQSRPNLKITIIYGKKELAAAEQRWLREVPHVKTRYCHNLHAKCYLSEDFCIITSLNLHRFSQQNNNEMGVFIQRAQDEKLFIDASKEVDRIFQLSDETNLGREELVLSAQAEGTKGDDRMFAKLSTSRLAKKLGLRSGLLVQQMLGRGFVKLKNGKPNLTDKGRAVGGEPMYSVENSHFIVWPRDLRP
jgi:phosphatidylserine/phosphatidylglycerophosphate/cardiolipin synthase-like enzyme